MQAAPFGIISVCLISRISTLHSRTANHWLPNKKSRPSCKDSTAQHPRINRSLVIVLTVSTYDHPIVLRTIDLHGVFDLLSQLPTKSIVPERRDKRGGHANLLSRSFSHKDRGEINHGFPSQTEFFPRRRTVGPRAPL